MIEVEPPENTGLKTAMQAAAADRNLGVATTAVAQVGKLEPLVSRVVHRHKRPTLVSCLKSSRMVCTGRTG